MIVDPESELGKSLGITSNSYSKRYICPKCHRPSDMSYPEKSRHI